MKGLMIFADGFEDVEGIATTDILNRAKIDLTKVGFNNNVVKTSNNNTILFDKKLDEIDYRLFDFLIIPGGPAVFNILDKSTKISDIITYFVNNDKYVFTICAAPLLVGKLGFFDNLTYTCFPGCDTKIIKGTRKDMPVVVENKFITARSMYYSCDFALEIVRKIKGNDAYNQIKDQISGINRG